MKKKKIENQNVLESTVLISYNLDFVCLAYDTFVVVVEEEIGVWALIKKKEKDE